MYVKNRPGLSVRDPERGDRLPPGQYRAVPDSDYWHRRVQDGDVMRHPDPLPEEVEGYIALAPEAAAEPEAAAAEIAAVPASAKRAAKA